MPQLPDFLKLVKGSMDDDEPCDLLLSEPIGFDPDTYSGISARAFGSALSSFNRKKPVNLLINTLGGRCDEGIAMYNMVAARGNVTTVVIGYAASMGAIIFQAGATRKMMPGTMMMIHNPLAQGGGDHRDMEAQAKMLKQVKDSFVDLLSARTGTGKREISRMMDETTYMDPAEAKKNGFCDEVVDVDPAWNSLASLPASTIAKNFRQVLARCESPRTEPQQTQNKEPKMKSLIIALAGAGLLPSADMSDEGAITAALNTSLAARNQQAEEITGLKEKLKAHEDAAKLRVTNKVETAITGGLVKAERKESLINLGVANEADLDAQIADLSALKGTAVPAKGAKGAPAVPPSGSATGAASNEDRITEIQNKLKTARGVEAVNLSRELNKLQGRELFTK